MAYIGVFPLRVVLKSFRGIGIYNIGPRHQDLELLVFKCWASFLGGGGGGPYQKHCIRGSLGDLY